MMAVQTREAEADSLQVSVGSQTQRAAGRLLVAVCQIPKPAQKQAFVQTLNSDRALQSVQKPVLCHPQNPCCLLLRTAVQTLKPA